MMLRHWILILFLTLGSAVPAHAQMSCGQAATALNLTGTISVRESPKPLPLVSTEPRTPSRIDHRYVQSVRQWFLRHKLNFIDRLLGARPGLAEGEQFQMQSFLDSREFRGWMELQNRVRENLAETHPTSAARIKLLLNAQEAITAKLLAIRQARHTIDVSYYIFKNDQTGLAFVHELKLALSRGVQVRVLIDSMGTPGVYGNAQLRSLIDHASRYGGEIIGLDGRPTGAKAKAEVVAFNPFTHLPVIAFRTLIRKINSLFDGTEIDSTGYSWNRRSHDKILLIDGAFQDRAIGFIGGRNMSNDYYGIPKMDETTFVDFEVLIRGIKAPEGQRTVGTSMTDYFDQVYFHLGNRRVHRSLLGMIFGYGRGDKKAKEAHQAVEEILGLNTDPEGLRHSLLELGYSESQVDIVHTIHNLYRKNASREYERRDYRAEVQNGQALMAKLETVIAQENQEVVIVSPYLWLSQKQIRLLKAWLLRDPARRLKLVTNSVMTNDLMTAQILGDNVLGPELKLDKGVFNAAGKQIRRSISDQVEIYQYGHIDAVDLGGSVTYGRLHAKGMLLKSSGISVIGTFNNDPRSLLLNTEGAAVMNNRQIADQFSNEIDQLIQRSHLWGSPEYHAIRSHPRLSDQKRLLSRYTERIYGAFLRLNMWWII